MRRDVRLVPNLVDVNGLAVALRCRFGEAAEVAYVMRRGKGVADVACGDGPIGGAVQQEGDL